MSGDVQVGRVKVGEREFAAVPLVKRSSSDGMGVVFFHGRNNPFGNPMEIWKLYKNDSVERIMERCYGIAYKQQGARFRKFNRRVHVVAPGDIPNRGTNRHLVDPSKGRNYANMWIRQTKDGEHFVYREWPNQVDYIPGAGVMGPWAIADGKKLDGRPGEGATPVGYGLMDYLRLWAMFEQWPDAWEARVAALRSRSALMDAEEQGVAKKQLSKVARLSGGEGGYEGFDGWAPGLGVNLGAAERVYQRIIDSRAASEPKTNIEGFRYTGLQSEFSEIGLDFDLAPGKQIGTGVNLVVNALAFDESEPVGFENSPDLYVSSDCKNTIFSLETWTGEDGNKGACKDFVDLLRYYFESKPEYVPEEMIRGGGRRSGGSPY